MYKIWILCSLFFCCKSASYAQELASDSLFLPTVPVFGIKSAINTPDRNVSVMGADEIRNRGGRTLTDALAAMPGVSLLTTGSIAKPVIRGMYGNRIQVNVGGLRLEDQQWEDEHGLALSDAGVERIELVRGAAALLYGSDAMGGVINVVEEDLQTGPSQSKNLNLKYFGNTCGPGLDLGYKKRGKNSFSCRASAENHSDYRDGAGYRTPNTRFALYNLKLGHLYQKGRLRSENRLLGAFNLFGFLTDSVQVKQKSDLGRSFKNGPHHSAVVVVFSSKNTFQLNARNEIALTAGYQTNLREEQERGNRTDLNLLLTTLSANVSLKRDIGRNWLWTNGLALMNQQNTNHGGRIIVPDAAVREGAVYSYVKKSFGSANLGGSFDAGLRYDRRRIRTLPTREFNTPSSLIPAFNRPFDDFNGAVGQNLHWRDWTFKTDLSTGFRAGNLSELAADGLHEGTPNWYLGNPDLKVEKCLNLDVYAARQIGPLEASADFFVNRFFNYIYLNPSGTEYFGFPLFEYLQNDAVFKGFEAGLHWVKPEQFTVTIDYSYLHARRTDGAKLPFIPANRLLFNAQYLLPVPKNSTLHQLFLHAGLQYNAAQESPAANETPTPAYTLLSAGISLRINNIKLSISGRNLGDRLYTDHLSRFKYIGAYEPGRSIVLNAGIVF